MMIKMENQGAVRFDKLKWLLAFTFLLAGLIVNHYYSQISMLLRTLTWLVILAIAGFIASKTQKGKWVLEFFRDARVELRKVIWPTREETVQTTLVVAVMVVILALILWGIDGILVWIIGWLTGQRG